jgi:hypothetical protein
VIAMFLNDGARMETMVRSKAAIAFVTWESVTASPSPGKACGKSLW